MATLGVQSLPHRAVKVHKFGGSSLQDAAHINRVVQTIQGQVQLGDVVVVSANGPVTDWLLAWLGGSEQAWHDLAAYLTHLIQTTVGENHPLASLVTGDLQRLQTNQAVSAISEAEILAHGERWSARLLAAKLQQMNIPNVWLDASQFLVVDAQQQAIKYAQVQQHIQHASRAANHPAINIVTGFIAQNEAGECVTLGRNGSDYTATILGQILQAEKVFLWTDYDGVYTADPRLLKSAQRVPSLTRSEAQALSELGSSVLHPKTMAPLLQQHTPLTINACQSGTAGTDVVTQNFAQEPGSIQVKTLAHKSGLIHLKLSEVTELQARQLQAQLTVAQISNFANHFDQTQNKLGFYVEHADCFKATQLIKSLGLTLNQQQTGISLISAVGQQIRQDHRIIGRFLNRTSLFRVYEYHYPANEHTLSVLVGDDQATAALQDLHQTFFELEPSLPIVVLGYGNIGRQFMRLLAQHKTAIEQRVKQSLRVVAVANSRAYHHSEACLLDSSISLEQANDLGQLFEQLAYLQGQPAVVIDLTASEAVARQYLNWARHGWHLISANKLAAADHDWAESIEQSIKQRRRLWLKNTTVGAALPVQSSIQKIQDSGDQVRAVSGVFSGSLSWLFGQFDGQRPFMEWVQQAHTQAYTEPDPRDDLSGQDVYRKALILARELGFKADQITFEPVIPKRFLSGSLVDFWQRAEAINDHFLNLWQRAQQQGQVLRYLARVTAKELRVELKAVATAHPAANLKPGDNIFIIESDWYADNPLVIQGPGAGREVTAAGVLNDLIEVLQSA